MKERDGMRERNLWLQVIRQAQEESQGRHYVEAATRAVMVRYLARKWLTRWTRSYALVCSLAGLTPQQAHRLQEDEREIQA